MEISIGTYDVEREGKNVMGLMTDGAKSKTESVLMSVLLLSKKDPGGGIGKWIPYQALVSLTERKSRLSLIQKVEQNTKEEVASAITQLLAPIKARVHTVTSDNGKEFSDHDTIAETLKAGYYSAHPYAAWERGLNENTDGLIRQYFPKRRDFTTITIEEIDIVTHRLNNRSRKCLGFKKT